MQAIIWIYSNQLADELTMEYNAHEEFQESLNKKIRSIEWLYTIILDSRATCSNDTCIELVTGYEIEHYNTYSFSSPFPCSRFKPNL